ncbi:YbhN family protein [uncultured Bilophila sp.]|uniref:lysylphosphatidylglycerol synthase transmembrane domain-containing protein n=1 Tax=uncultured Bilophila sp. TaxID=529385 RepID=UPI0025D4AE4C|nr:lysylphosphatidylglycerol synthetase family protein [uncultured Bilophila sp.]
MMLKNVLSALKRLLRALGPVIVGCIFLGAVYLLYKEISKYSLADIRMSLAQISTGSIILSVALAVVNYIILIGYDWLALKGIHKTLPVSRVSLVSFVGQAVSYNFGALLGGSTVRFRFYSSWGFSPMDIVRLVLMLAITFWVGALGLVGAIFMIAPPDIPPELGMHMPMEIRPLGVILFLIAASYLVVCKFIHKPIHIFGREFSFPPFKIAVAQALVAGADLVAAGACLYVLLPPDAHVSFLQFLPTYLMAMVAVVLTHVPGGAGVLEVVILHLTTASPQAVFAALLCFRVIYYLLPLLLAAVIFAVYEIRQQTVQASGALHDAGRWMRAFAPTIMASAVFGAGAILCFSVVLPISPERFAQLREWIPLGVVEAGSMATGAAGVMLLFLARGIQHRQRIAFRLTIAMLCIGVIGPLLHALGWLVSLMMFVVLLCVLSLCRKCCRSSSLWKLHITFSWLFAISSVLVCSAGLGLLLYHLDPYDPALWTTSEYTADSSRLFRTLTAEALLVFAIAVGYARTVPLRKRWKAVRRFGRSKK